jgi:hypothetical protein
LDDDNGLEYDLDDIDAVADAIEHEKATEHQKRHSKTTMQRDEVLQSLGYKPDRVLQCIHY